MQNIKYFLLLVVTISFLSSCKKDDQEEIVDDTDAFSVKIDNEDINANTQSTAYVKIFTTVGESGQLGFNISNDIDNDIKLKMTVVDVVGRGEGVQVCFETCSLAIILNHSEIKAFPVGYTSTDAETHVYNSQDGDRDFECTIKINQVNDNNMDIEGGKEVFFTYKYDAP